ncbi:MAG: MFS transporter [Proteobacteria bacterium]|nr:MFS transporter [Pseudomonadota bacterium]
MTRRAVGLLLVVFGLVVFGGAVMAFNQPVRLAIVPSLVPREDMASAIGINSLMFNAARFVGPRDWAVYGEMFAALRDLVESGRLPLPPVTELGVLDEHGHFPERHGRNRQPAL